MDQGLWTADGQQARDDQELYTYISLTVLVKYFLYVGVITYQKADH